MSGHQDKTHDLPADYSAAQREQQVLQLRLQGLEFDEIAHRTGYHDRSGAHKAWKRVLARMPIIETRHEREESKMRLNVALDALWAKVQKGDVWAIDRMLAIEKRRAELLGLDRPAQKAEPAQPQPLDVHVNFDPGVI